MSAGFQASTISEVHTLDNIFTSLLSLQIIAITPFLAWKVWHPIFNFFLGNFLWYIIILTAPQFPQHVFFQQQRKHGVPLQHLS